MACAEQGKNPRSTQRVPTTKVNIKGVPAPQGSRAQPALAFFLLLLKFGGAIFFRMLLGAEGSKF